MDESASSAAREELVIPPARRVGIFRLALCGGLVVFGLAMAAAGFIGGDALPAVFGGLLALLFGIVLVQEVRVLRSPGLRLTAEGYELNGHMRAWSDVEGFQLVGATNRMKTHIFVRYARGARLSRGEKVSVALGRLGYFSAPAYIPRGSFTVGGQPLERILRQWWRGDGDAAGPTG